MESGREQEVDNIHINEFIAPESLDFKHSNYEFYRAARNVGGTFIQISPASQNCINVMEIRKVDNSVNELLDGPTLDASALASKIQRLHVFFSLLIPDMSHPNAATMCWFMTMKMSLQPMYSTLY